MSALLGRPGPGSAVASWRDALAASVAWGVAVAIVSRPAIAAGVAVAAFAGSRWSAGRTASRVGTVAALLALPAYEAWEQIRYHYWPSIAWPSQMTAANDIAWAALALIGADLVSGWARWHSARRRETASSGSDGHGRF